MGESLLIVVKAAYDVACESCDEQVKKDELMVAMSGDLDMDTGGGYCIRCYCMKHYNNIFRSKRNIEFAEGHIALMVKRINELVEDPIERERMLDMTDEVKY